MAAFRYKAFISYAWADAKWGNWLHKALETYRTPKTLVGIPYYAWNNRGAGEMAVWLAAARGPK